MTILKKIDVETSTHRKEVRLSCLALAQGACITRYYYLHNLLRIVDSEVDFCWKTEDFIVL